MSSDGTMPWWQIALVALYILVGAPIITVAICYFTGMGA